MKVEFRELNEDDEELIWNIVYVTADMEKSGETIEQAKQNLTEEDTSVTGKAF